VTWTSATVFKVFVDGAYKGTVTSSDPITSWSGSTWYLGMDNSSITNSMAYRDVRVSNIARSDSEIANDAALSDVPIDNATTFKLDANGSIY